MPPRKVQFVQGAYYHIYNRGAGRQSICKRDDDYVRLLHLIKRISRQCQLTIVAYCLLPNHYHWLVLQDGPAPARLLPQRVFTSYTRTFNRIYDHSGTLFEDRFEALHVDTDAYLRHLCRYIHANPARHGVVNAPALWPYSNFQEWMGLRAGSLVNHAFVETHFPDRVSYGQSVVAYAASQEMDGGPTFRD